AESFPRSDEPHPPYNHPNATHLQRPSTIRLCTVIGHANAASRNGETNVRTGQMEKVTSGENGQPGKDVHDFHRATQAELTPTDAMTRSTMTRSTTTRRTTSSKMRSV
ncbi:MAG: hypothetical protein ACK52S_04395, partial [Pirellula sp.]